MDTVDLAVIGAGPAGSAAAVSALRADPGATVVLIDRSEFPRDKACGDGIGPEGVDVLEGLGLRDVLRGYPELRRVRVRAPDGREVAGSAPRPGHVVPRRVLDQRLREAAIEHGARPMTHRFRELASDPHGVVIDNRLRARTVIGADGANSRVRRSAGARRQPRSRTGLAIRGYADDHDLDELFIAFVPTSWPAYAWAFPTGRGQVNVGFGPFDATLVGSRDDLLAGLRRHLPAFDPDPATLRAHHLPLSTARPRPAHGRVLLAGDAASLVNPLTGEGIYYALLSGALAGAAAVRRPDEPGPAYGAALRARLGRHLRHTSVAARLFRWQAPVTLSVEAAARRPRVLADLCEFALGTGLITPSMVRTLVATAATASPRRIAS